MTPTTIATTPDVDTFEQRIQCERAAERAAYDALIARAPAILATLNAADDGQWALDILPPDPDSAYYRHARPVAVHPSGMRLTFQIGGWKKAGRLTIDGDYPRNRDGSIPSLYDKADRISEITVAPDTADDRIGRAIAKRLIPGYRDAWQRLSAKIAASDDYAARGDANAKRLAATLNGNLGSRNGGSACTVHASSLTLECHGDSVSLRYLPSVSVDTAIAIARLVSADKGDA